MKQDFIDIYKVLATVESCHFIMGDHRTIVYLTSFIYAVLMTLLVVILCFCNFDRNTLDKLVFTVLFVGCVVSAVICIYLDARTNKLVKESRKISTFNKLDFSEKDIE